MRRPGARAHASRAGAKRHVEGTPTTRCLAAARLGRLFIQPIHRHLLPARGARRAVSKKRQSAPDGRLSPSTGPAPTATARQSARLTSLLRRCPCLKSEGRAVVRASESGLEPPLQLRTRAERRDASMLDCGEHCRADQDLLSRVAATIGLARARSQSTSLLSQSREAFVDRSNASEHVFRHLAPPRAASVSERVNVNHRSASSKECAEHGSCSTRDARRQMLAPLVRHVRNQVDVMRRHGISESVWKRQKPPTPDSREWTSRVKKRHRLSSSENGRPPRKTFAIRQLGDSSKDDEKCAFPE